MPHSFIVSAPINSSIYEIYPRFRNLLKCCENLVRHPADQPIELDTDLLIIGMGRIGTGMYDVVRDSYGRKVVGLADNNDSTVKQHDESGRDVVFGDVTDIDFWDKIKPEQINLIALCMPLHETNVIAVKQMQKAVLMIRRKNYARWESTPYITFMLTSFFPPSALLVVHITRYAPASRLEDEKKIILISVQLILLPFLIWVLLMPTIRVMIVSQIRNLRNIS